MVLLFCLGRWVCKKQEEQPAQEIDSASPAVVTFHDEKSKPSVHISNAFPRQKEMIVKAYQQNLAYYKVLSSKDIARIRFVGVDAPWKPKAERHYCIDTPQRQAIKEGGGQEDVYYFANYCRSLSTIFRESDRIFKSYIDFKNCEDLCNCAVEKHLDVFPAKAKSCMKYCKDVTWEQLCSSSADLNRKCCL